VPPKKKFYGWADADWYGCNFGAATQLVLVDELAHTNVPGSERGKRYQGFGGWY